MIFGQKDSAVLRTFINCWTILTVVLYSTTIKDTEEHHDVNATFMFGLHREARLHACVQNVSLCQPSPLPAVIHVGVS